MSFTTPIILNNFNRLTTTRQMAEDLYDLGYTNVRILDNGSTYPKLLEWYNNCPFPVERVNNLQGLALWNSGYINTFPQGSWVAYSDSDLELNPDTPQDFLSRMVLLATKYKVDKVGLALNRDDIPEDNEYSLGAKNWEAKYWEREVEKEVYDAEVDTTFSILKVGLPFQYSSLRVAGPFTARHIPWYNKWDSLDEEERYYLEHCGEWSTYGRMYQKYKQNQIIT